MAGEKPTKYCELTITLVSGARVAGRFHIEARTTSTIRPSDAVREYKDNFLLLTDATCSDAESPDEPKSLMVPVRAIAYVELPGQRWITPPLTPLASAAPLGAV